MYVTKTHTFFFFNLKNFFFYFLAAPCSMWDLNSPTRDRTHIPCSGSTES